MTIGPFGRRWKPVSPFLLKRLIGKSHRTKPEQFVGLFLCLFLAFLASIVIGLGKGLGAGLFPYCLSFSMWLIWRLFSLKSLKIELFALLLSFVLQASWFVNHFLFQADFLALFSLLLLFSNLLLCILLFGKKEKLAGVFLAYPLFWTLYLIGTQMLS